LKRYVFERILAARSGKRPLAVATRLADGAQAVYEDNNATGELALTIDQLDEIRSMLVADRSGMLKSEPPVFVRCYGCAPRLLVVGAVHIGQVLASMAVPAGFDVTVIDPRRAFAVAERFPEVALTDEWPDEALARLGIDERTAVVTLTHDPKLDDPALIAALRGSPFYIGALGSTLTHAKRMTRLAQLGLGEASRRIHAPIGLALGGRSPAEIAVSILAEIIQVRYRTSRA